MPTINELKARHAKVLDEVRSIHDAAEKEDRALTDEEKTSFDDAKTRAAELRDRIKQAEELELEEARAARAERPHIEGVRDLAGDEEFRNFGELLVEVRSAATNRPSPRLLGHHEREARALGMSEAVPSEGGFLVGKDNANVMLHTAFETGQILSRVDKTPIGSNSNGLRANGIDESSRANGSRWGGVQAYWANEAASVTASKPKWREIKMDLEKLFAVYYATDELLEDTTALADMALKAFRGEITFKAEDSIINGDGAGKPLGVLNSGALVSVTRGTSDEISAADIFNVWSRMHANYRSNAVWFINQDVEPQLFQLIVTDGTVGGPVYVPPGGLNVSPYSTLMGRPVIPVEYCPTLGDEGDILFANFDQYLMIDKGGIKEAQSMHVQFLTGEQTFRLTYRLNGQPKQNTAITPYKGTNTLSPFVAIAA